MGQTQVLLLVLSVIIVGVAVSAGIDQFSENALTPNRDAVAADCQRIVSQSMQWYRKPTSLGGGGKDFTTMTFGHLGIATDSTGAVYTNQNGSYGLTAGNANQITILGTGSENKGDGTPVTVTLTYDATNNAFTYTDNINSGGQ